MNAYEELIEMLHDDEKVEAIEFTYGESGILMFKPNKPVPEDLMYKCMSLEKAKEYMLDWSFNSGHAERTPYTAHIWTSQRIIWVHEYDSATWLSQLPRNPSEIIA